MTTQKQVYSFIVKHENKHFIATGEEGFTIQELSKALKAKYNSLSRLLVRMTKEVSKNPLEATKDGTLIRYSVNITTRAIPIDADKFWKEYFIPYLRKNDDILLNSIRNNHGGNMKSGGGYQKIMKDTIDRLIEMGVVKTT